MRSHTLAVLAFVASAAPLPSQQVVQLGGADKPLPWKPVEVFTIGDDEAREEEQLARIIGTAFDRRDNLYILDGDNGRILVFDSAGRFVRQFGRKGEGPGELRFPGMLAVTSDDHVVVLDRGNRALVVYTLEGTYVRNVPIEQSMGIGGRFMAAHPESGVVFAVNPGVSMVDGAPQIDTSGVRVYWQKSFGEGARPELVHTAQEPVKPDPPRVERSGGATIVMMRSAPPAFSPQLLFAVLGNGALAVSRVPDYEIDVVRQPGRVSQRLVRPLKARRVTEADKEAEKKRRLEALRTGGGPTVAVSGGGPAGSRAAQITQDQLRKSMEENVRNLAFAETMPVVQGLYSDPTGRLWVWRAASTAGRPSVIDILGPDGRYVGTVSGMELPSSVSPGGLAAFSTMNEYDVPVVVVRRIPVP